MTLKISTNSKFEGAEKTSVFDMRASFEVAGCREAIEFSRFFQQI